MAEQFSKIFQAANERAFQLYEKFLAICPTDLWNKKAGGWPICNQYYHGLSAVAKMAASLGAQALEDPCPGAGNLPGKDLPMPEKEQAAKYLQEIRKSLAGIYTNLTDSRLLESNETLAALLGQPISNAGVLELMASHLLYHLGSCDAALRDQGLEGAF